MGWKSLCLVLAITPWLLWGGTAEAQYTIPLDGLVSWWQAEGGAADSQGSNDGVLAGDTDYVLGVEAESFAFDGDGDYVLVGATPDIDGGDAMTIMTWVRSEAAPAPSLYASLVVIGDFMQASWDGGQCRLLFGSPFNYGSASSARFYMDCGINDANLAVWRDTSEAYETGVWHQVAAVFDGGSIDIYVDGVLANGASSLLSGVVVNGSAENYLSLGAHYRASDQTSSNYLQGNLDEVAVYNRALTASEIAEAYDSAYSTSGTDILASNLRFTSSAGSLGAGGTTWAAGGFTNDSSMYRLTGVTSPHYLWSAGELSLFLFSDAAGNPGDLIATLGTVAHGESGIIVTEFNPGGSLYLDAATSYWLVGSSTGSVSFQAADSTAQEGSCSFVQSYRQSFDSGETWGSFSSSSPLRMHVEGVAMLFGDGFERGLPGGWSSVVVP